MFKVINSISNCNWQLDKWKSDKLNIAEQCVFVFSKLLRLPKATELKITKLKIAKPKLKLATNMKQLFITIKSGNATLCR